MYHANCISEASQAQGGNDKVIMVSVVTVSEKRSGGLFHVARLFAQLTLTRLQS
jgi:hypothetical protein